MISAGSALAEPAQEIPSCQSARWLTAARPSVRPYGPPPEQHSSSPLPFAIPTRARSRRWMRVGLCCGVTDGVEIPASGDDRPPVRGVTRRAACGCAGLVSRMRWPCCHAEAKGRPQAACLRTGDWRHVRVFWTNGELRGRVSHWKPVKTWYSGHFFVDRTGDDRHERLGKSADLRVNSMFSQRSPAGPRYALNNEKAFCQSSGGGGRRTPSFLRKTCGFVNGSLPG